jgi:hypothetical protein
VARASDGAEKDGHTVRSLIPRGFANMLLSAGMIRAQWFWGRKAATKGSVVYLRRSLTRTAAAATAAQTMQASEGEPRARPSNLQAPGEDTADQATFVCFLYRAARHSPSSISAAGRYLRFTSAWRIACSQVTSHHQTNQAGHHSAIHGGGPAGRILVTRRPA